MNKNSTLNHILFHHLHQMLATRMHLRMKARTTQLCPNVMGAVKTQLIYISVEKEPFLLTRVSFDVMMCFSFFLFGTGWTRNNLPKCTNLQTNYFFLYSRKNEIMHLLRLLLLISARAFGLGGMEDSEAAISRNCWSKVQNDEEGWSRIINFDEETSSLALFVNRTRPEVRTCLQSK